MSTTSKEVTIENPNLYCVLKPIQIQNIISGLSILLIASLSKPELNTAKRKISSIDNFDLFLIMFDLSKWSFARLKFNSNH